MGFHVKLVRLIGCPYSNKAKEILDNYKLSCNDIVVNPNESEKAKFKLGRLKTFPQIYMLNDKNEEYLVGDCSMLSNVVEFYESLKSTVQKGGILNNESLNNFIKNLNGQHDVRGIQYFLCLLCKKDSYFRQSNKCKIVY